MTEGTGGNDEVTGGKDGRGPTGVTEGAGVVVGWSPRRPRLSFPRKRESRGTGREPGAGRVGVVGRRMSVFGGGEKTMDSRLQPVGMTERGDRRA